MMVAMVRDPHPGALRATLSRLLEKGNNGDTAALQVRFKSSAIAVPARGKDDARRIYRLFFSCQAAR
jgi:hypothetical protein